MPEGCTQTFDVKRAYGSDARAASSDDVGPETLNPKP